MNLKNFRKTFFSYLDKQLETQQPFDEHALDAAFKSAEKNLATRKPAIRKPWITDHTYNLIIAKHKANKTRT